LGHGQIGKCPDDQIPPQDGTQVENDEQAADGRCDAKQAGKQQVEKEPDFFQKHKSTIWTILVLILLAVFFVINNTRKIPDQGPYPPNYLKGNTANETSE
ncbi:MAG: hypothetical protein OQK57_01375, partial [Ignavibacteriaceae bacterium]|nr:hypothetical protein [Ignavibacteriaceae bacterium]